MSEDHSNNFIKGLLVGVTVGAGAVYFFNTKKGRKVLGELMDRADEVLDHAEVITEDMEDKIEQQVAQLQEKGEALLEQAQVVKEKLFNDVEMKKKEVSKGVVEKLDETLSRIEEIQKKGVEVTEDFHEKYFKKGGKRLSS